MSRPRKPSSQKLAKDLRVPVTASQKRKIQTAAATEPAGMAAWIRMVLLREADAVIGGLDRRPSSPGSGVE